MSASRLSNSEGSQAVIRALEILRQFSLDRPTWSAKDLIEAAGLSSSTGHRLIKVLVDADFLSRDSSFNLYIAGPAIVDIASSVLNGSNDHELLSAALPFMEELHQLSRETVGVYRRAGMTRVALAALESPQPVKLTMNGGRMRPLLKGAPGKVFMAGMTDVELSAVIRFATRAGTPLDAERLRDELARIRELGYATSHEEATPGAASIAAPIVGTDDRVFAVISVSGPAYRWTPEAMAGVERQLRESAQKISEQLSHKQHGVKFLGPLSQETSEPTT
jgi:DNA-binding IclR family transcriptional regulator